jgi:hypothetical protein
MRRMLRYRFLHDGACTFSARETLQQDVKQRTALLQTQGEQEGPLPPQQGR